MLASMQTIRTEVDAIAAQLGVAPPPERGASQGFASRDERTPLDPARAALERNAGAALGYILERAAHGDEDEAMYWLQALREALARAASHDAALAQVLRAIAEARTQPFPPWFKQ